VWFSDLKFLKALAAVIDQVEPHILVITGLDPRLSGLRGGALDQRFDFIANRRYRRWEDSERHKYSSWPPASS